MDDLISRSELLQWVRSDSGDKLMNEFYAEYIENMPTACDIDNIVKELEIFLINYGIPKKTTVHQKIINIVKAGGLND